MARTTFCFRFTVASVTLTAASKLCQPLAYHHETSSSGRKELLQLDRDRDDAILEQFLFDEAQGVKSRVGEPVVLAEVRAALVLQAGRTALRQRPTDGWFATENPPAARLCHGTDSA
jgi:hypothetical protein